MMSKTEQHHGAHALAVAGLGPERALDHVGVHARRRHADLPRQHFIIIMIKTEDTLSRNVGGSQPLPWFLSRC
jgi:hypothetical protein